MIEWSERSPEERALLNPAFNANILWHAATGYAEVNSEGLSYEETFLVLPFILHRPTRETLPRAVATSLAVWLDQNPLARGRISSRARMMVDYTKEALIFAGMHKFIAIDSGKVLADSTWKRTVNRTLRDSSDEVRHCATRASFVGKWFANTGSPTTVLALMGVKP